MRSKSRQAFTLIELLVVVAIIALLIAILIPSLQSAKEAARKAKCLANMKQIATGMHIYANDDSKSIAFPVQPVFGDSTTVASLTRPDFLYITWWSWGGRDGVTPWQFSSSARPYIREFDTAVPPAPESLPAPHFALYAARHRPLNRTLYPNGITPTGQDRFDLPMFQCPADSGYPLDSPFVGELIDDAPVAMRKVPMYDGVGNSYRASFACWFLTQRRVFTTGPGGHRLDSIPAVSETLWFADSLFFNMIGTNGAIPATSNTTLNFMGWHKKRAADNVAFVDGSARFVEILKRVAFDSSMAQAMGVENGGSGFLHRGADYRLDVYPTGGAVLMKSLNNSTAWVHALGDANLWPIRGYQNNFN